MAPGATRSRGPSTDTPLPDPSRQLSWRVLMDGPQSGPRNMAVDEALARGRGTGAAILRLYRWSHPTVSFGRNEPATGKYDEALAQQLGVRFVRRPTGGRAVLHHQELTYSVVVGVGAIGGLRETYNVINRALQSALVATGADVTLAPEGGAVPALNAGPCFDTPAAGEVIADGRKLVGSAQVRIGKTILQHGSIILAGNQDVIARLGGSDQAQAPATLEALLGATPDPAVLAQSVEAGFRRHFGGSWCKGELKRDEHRLADDLEDTYSSREWTWRA